MRNILRAVSAAALLGCSATQVDHTLSGAAPADDGHLVSLPNSTVCPDTAARAGPIFHNDSIDVPALYLAGNPGPRYPPDVRERGEQGEVVAEFVVNIAGCMQSGSFRVVSATRPEFVPPVRAALRRSRYEPGRNAGERVAARVQQAFRFTIQY